MREMLGEKIARHEARVWLVNTGWTGGPYGVGTRMKIKYHARDDPCGAGRAARRRAATRRIRVFNLDVPLTCPGVPADVLKPRNTWADKARLRPAGAEARAHVRRQLQGLRARRVT